MTWTDSIPRWLVRHRVALFVTMVLLVVGSVFLIPHVHINGDMTLYLPDASPMKQGMDLMEQQMPAIQQYMRTEGNLVVDGNDLMPADLPQTLATGVLFVFLVLLVMSASFMEVPLFLATIGFAVAINMGTNAFFSSVSMLTNSLAAILQMVLSMDYSIILMNRYRQEKQLGRDPLQAMETAIGGAASSILSSAFTTIVSLLMLVFMKLKIGADLGFVLSKGVALSLLCNFTVLPCLIVWSDKAIARSAKKMLQFPSAVMARFQYRFRVPLAVLFVGAFVAFALLQRRTQLYFAPDWDSKASEVRNEVNTLLLLYDTGEEGAVPAMLDSIQADPRVQQGISYPSLVLRPRTIDGLRELMQGAGDQAPALPEDMLRLVYYAHEHPRRTERFSFNEIQDLLDTLKAKGLVSVDLRPEALFQAEAPQTKAEVSSVVADDKADASPEEVPMTAEVPSVVADTEPVAPQEEAPALQEEPEPQQPVRDPRLDYDEIIKLRDAAGMAAFLGWDRNQVSMAYRLAGDPKGLMTLPEFMKVVKEKVLGNKRYSAFISKQMRQDFLNATVQVDSVLAAGPAPVIPGPDRESHEMAGQAGHDVVAGHDVDTLAVMATPEHVIADPEPAIHADEPVIPGSDRESPAPAAPTPQEELLDMVLSPRRYSSRQVYRALSRAGLDVTRDQLDLLYLYGGALRDFDPETAIAPGVLLDYVADTLLTDPVLAPLVPGEARDAVESARKELMERVGMLREPQLSAAVVLSDYERESEPAFAHVDRVRAAADAALQRPHYWVGESEMYKELKDGFPQELLLLTVLTVLAIFLIVAVNFKSVLIPVPLIMTILSGIYANIWASGLGGHSLYYMSYLIIQGILMGATIDYTILLMTYYLAGRREGDVQHALQTAFQGASHSILTSGLILAIVPYVMSLIMSDKVIASILRSLAVGTAVILLFVFLLLPGVIAALDPVIRRRRDGFK